MKEHLSKSSSPRWGEPDSPESRVVDFHSEHHPLRKRSSRPDIGEVRPDLLHLRPVLAPHEPTKSTLEHPRRLGPDELERIHCLPDVA